MVRSKGMSHGGGCDVAASVTVDMIVIFHTGGHETREPLTCPNKTTLLMVR